MSVESMSWALNLTVEMPPARKLVLIGIANHDGDGGAWPSIATLARYAGISERNVQKHIAALEADGLISRKIQEGGTARTRPHERPNLYVVNRVSPATPPVTNATPPGVTSDTPPVSPAPPEPSIEPSIEPSESVEPDTRRLCELMADLIESTGSKRPNVTERWMKDMRRLQHVDGRNVEDIEVVLRWLYAGRDDVSSFWMSNILSPGKLRTKWDQMRLQYLRKVEPRRSGVDAMIDQIAQEGADRESQ